MARAATSTEARFWKFVQLDMETGCFLWCGGLYQKGYGSFMMPTPKGWCSHYAHRLAWEFSFGPIPKGMHVLHKCDVRNCVRFDHLFLGTNADNVADMIAKRRHSHGARHTSAKLTEAQARKILTAQGTQAAIAERYGVTRQTVSDIRRGKHWKHMGGTREKSSRGGGAKLNIALAREIRASEEPRDVLAWRLGVSRETIALVHAGRTWKEE